MQTAGRLNSPKQRNAQSVRRKHMWEVLKHSGIIQKMWRHVPSGELKFSRQKQQKSLAAETRETLWVDEVITSSVWKWSGVDKTCTKED